MRLTLATSAAMTRLEVEDELLLERCRRRGIPAEVRAWEAPLDDTPRLWIIRTTWNYWRRLPEFLAWVDAVASRAPLWNPPAVVRWNADKRYLLDLAERGLPIVPTACLATADPSTARPEELRQTLDGHAWTRAIIKPRVSAGGSECLRLDRHQPATLSAAAEALAGRGPFLIQPFVETISEHGERSLIFLHGRFSHAVEKHPGEGEHRVHLEYAGRQRRVDPRPAELALASRCLDALPSPSPLCYARVDLLFAEDGAPLISELELIEPSLYLDEAPDRVEAWADGLEALLAGAVPR